MVASTGLLANIVVVLTPDPLVLVIVVGMDINAHQQCGEPRCLAKDHNPIVISTAIVVVVVTLPTAQY